MQKKKDYTHLFFDLDHTLWDFDKNSRETLLEMFYEYELDILLKIPIEKFIQQYEYNNRDLWNKYENGELSREELRWKRFYNSLAYFGLKDEDLSKILAEKYLQISPYKPHLIPFCIEILEYLHEKHTLTIITNGFEEVQYIKLKHTKLEKYFDHIVTSESAGCKKPDPSIFKYSLDLSNGTRKNSLMIGDSFLSDILGAKNYGIDQAYYNPHRNRHNQKATYDIACLSDLLKIV